MDKTPLNLAIDDLNTEISRCKCNDEYEVGRSQALEAAKFILESLLPKEKEFVGNVYTAGARWQRQWDQHVTYEANTPESPDKQQFINQLYSQP